MPSSGSAWVRVRVRVRVMVRVRVRVRHAVEWERLHYRLAGT